MEIGKINVATEVLKLLIDLLVVSLLHKPPGLLVVRLYRPCAAAAFEIEEQS